MKYTLLFFFALFTLNFNAQEHLLGVKSNVAVTGITQQVITTDYLIKPGIGLTYEKRGDNRISYGIEAILSPRGFKTSILFSDSLGNETGEGFILTKLNYLNIPIKVGYQLKEEGSAWVKFGVAPSFLLNDQEEFQNFGYTPELPYNPEFDNFDLTSVLEYVNNLKATEKGELYMSLGAFYGLKSIYTDADTYEQVKIRNVGAELSLGYRWNR